MMKITLYVKMCIILAQLLMESSVSDVRIVLQYLLNTICNYCSHITFDFVVISYILYTSHLLEKLRTMCIRIIDHTRTMVGQH